MVKQYELDFEGSWINELFQWADNNHIPELQYYEDLWDEGNDEWIDHGFWIGLPRNKEALLSLEELDLSWHSCSQIPDQIRHLTKLKALRFAKRPDGLQPPFSILANGQAAIEEIPDWISQLENLEEMDLSGNKIKYIPARVAKLKRLKKLYLHENKIAHFDQKVSNLDSLEVLWVYGNHLSTLKEKKIILGMKNLKELWCDGLDGSEYGPFIIKE